jgi:hypothetical protein
MTQMSPDGIVASGGVAIALQTLELLEESDHALVAFSVDF